jgi:hypothetical protein
MVFRRPKFFLDLGGGEGKQKPAVVAPAAAEPDAKSQRAPDKKVPALAAVASGVPDSDGAPVLTTAAAIAAELAAAEASRPAPSNATFAPECLTPGGASPLKRRVGGANLAGFKAMAAGMMRN